MAEITPDLPVLRDPDGCTYFKEDAGKLLVGAFDPEGKPLPMEHLPSETAFIELPDDWDQFELPYTRAAEILPPLAQAGIAKFMNGPESFTPDLLFMLGEAPGLPNCFVSAGYNSEGIELAAGAGRAIGIPRLGRSAAEEGVEAPQRGLLHEFRDRHDGPPDFDEILAANPARFRRRE